jgi:hypothetical protein
MTSSMNRWVTVGRTSTRDVQATAMSSEMAARQGYARSPIRKTLVITDMSALAVPHGMRGVKCRSRIKQRMALVVIASELAGR